MLDPGIGDEQIGGMLRTSIGLDRMRAAWAERRERLPRDHGQLSMLDASMSYLRQFAPAVLAAVQFAGGPGTEQLLQAKSRHRHLATLGIYVRLGEETSARITAENDEHHRRHRR